MAVIGRKGYPIPFRRFMKPIYNSSVYSILTVATARVYLIPIEVEVRCTVDRILIYLLQGTIAGNWRVGIYKDGTVTDIPDGGALVVESASVAKAGTWRKQLVTIGDTLLEPGLYWIAVQSDENTTIVSSERNIWGAIEPRQRYYDRGGGYGALTDPCPATTPDTMAPFSLFRIKSMYQPVI